MVRCEAPCGISTYTPPLAKSLVRPVQRQIKISRSEHQQQTGKIARRGACQSRAPSRAARAVQIVPQDDRRGDVIERNFSLIVRCAPASRAAPASRGSVAEVVCLASQELSRSSISSTGMPSAFLTRSEKLFASSDISLGEPSRCSGRPTTMRRTFSSRTKSRRRPRSPPPVGPGPGGEGAGSDAGLVGKRQAQPFFAVIDRQNHTRRARSFRVTAMRVTERHTIIITWKERTPVVGRGPCHPQVNTWFLRANVRVRRIPRAARCLRFSSARRGPWLSIETQFRRAIAAAPVAPRAQRCRTR